MQRPSITFKAIQTICETNQKIFRQLSRLKKKFMEPGKMRKKVKSLSQILEQGEKLQQMIKSLRRNLEKVPLAHQDPGPEWLKFKCVYCGYRIRSWQGLWEHLRKIHGSDCREISAKSPRLKKVVVDRRYAAAKDRKLQREFKTNPKT
jgi:hypothetical protein